MDSSCEIVQLLSVYARANSTSSRVDVSPLKQERPRAVNRTI